MSKDLGEAILRIRIQLDSLDVKAVLEKLNPLKAGLAQFAKDASSQMAGLIGPGGSLTQLATDLNTVAKSLKDIKNSSNVLKPLAQYQKALQGKGAAASQAGVTSGNKEFLSEISRVDKVITDLLRKRATATQGLTDDEEQILRAAKERLRVLQKINQQKSGIFLNDLGPKQVSELAKILGLFDKVPKSIEETRARLKTLDEASSQWSKNFLPQATIDRIRKAGEEFLKLQQKASSRNALETLRGMGDFVGKTENSVKKLIRTFAASAKSPKDLQAAMAALSKKFDDYFKSLTKTAIAEGRFTDANNLREQSLRRMSATLTKSIKDVDLLRIALEALDNSQKKSKKSQNIVAIGSTVKERIQSTKSINKSNDIGLMTNNLESLKKFSEQLFQSGQVSLKTLQALRKAIDDTSSSIGRLKKIETARQLENIRQAFASVSSGVAQVGEQVRRVSFILRDVGRQIVDLGQAMVGLLKPNMDAFADFEQGVVDILAITGNLKGGFEEVGVVSSGLAKQILELAASSRFSSTEIADAAKTLALAGLTLDEIQGSLESLTTLSAATGSSLAEAANIVVSTMTTFQVETSESARIADIFTAAVTRSNTNLNKLQEALKVVAPTAASMGQSVQGTVAALGALANAGIRGSAAGTGLSRIMTQLVEKSGDLDPMLRALGSSFSEIDPEKVGIVDIIKKFEELNLTTSQLLDVFDLRAFRSFQAIMQQGADSVSLLNKQLLESSAIAQTIAKQRLNTVAASMELLSDAVNALRIRLGELVAKEFKFLVDALAKVTEYITALVEGYKEEFAEFLKIFAGLAGVALSLGTALFSIGTAASFAAAPLIVMASVLTTISAIVTAATTGIMAAGGTIAALLPTLGAIAAGLAVLGAAISAVTAGFVGLFVAVGVAVAQNFDMLVIYVQGWIEAFLGLAKAIIGSFLEGWNAGKEAITESFRGLLNQLVSMGMDIGNAFGSGVSGGMKSFGEGLAKTLAFLIDGLTSFLRLMSDYIIPTITTFYNIMTNVALTITKFTYDLIESFGGWEALQRVLSSLLTTLTAVTAIISGASFAALAVALATIVSALAAIVSLFTAIYDLGAWLSGATDDIAAAQERLNKAIEQQNKIIQKTIASAKKYAAVIKSQSDAELRQVDSYIESLKAAQDILNDMSEATPETLTKSLQTVGDALNGGLQTQIDSLVKAKAEVAKEVERVTKLDPDGLRSPQINALKASEEGLQKRIEALEKMGRKTKESSEITERVFANAGKGADQELTRLIANRKKYEDILTGINKVAINIGEESVFEAFKKDNNDVFQSLTRLKDEINRTFGVDLKLESYQDYVDLIKFTQTNVSDAATETQGYITEVNKLLPILEKMRARFPDFANLNFGDPEDRKKILEFFKLAKDDIQAQTEAAMAQKDIMKELVEIEKQLAEAQLNTFQQAMKAHEDETAAINEKIAKRIEFLEVQEQELQMEIERENLSEEHKKNSEENLQRVREELEMRREMRDQAKEVAEQEKRKVQQDFIDKRGQVNESILEEEIEAETNAQKKIELQRKLIREKEERERRKAVEELEGMFDTRDVAQRRDMETQREKLISSRQAAMERELNELDENAKKEAIERDKEREIAKIETLEKELEATTDIQTRIALRTEIFTKKEKMDREEAHKKLMENYDMEDEAQRKLYEIEKKRLDLAWDDARDKNLNDIVEEENKKDKEKEKKELEKVHEIAKKRIDLEYDMVNTLSKQVTSLAQMAQIMLFIEKIQKRREGAARKALEAQIEANRKVADLEARAAAGDELAKRALPAARARAALAGGIFDARKVHAGLGGGAQHFFDQFLAGLNDLIAQLTLKPLKIPAVFDTDFMIKDLLAKMKDVKIKVGVDFSDRLFPGSRLMFQGINTGTINNYSNSALTINTKNLPKGIADKLGNIL